MISYIPILLSLLASVSAALTEVNERAPDGLAERSGGYASAKLCLARDDNWCIFGSKELGVWM